MGNIPAKARVKPKLDTFAVIQEEGDKVVSIKRFKSKAETLEFLTKNPTWNVTDGIYRSSLFGRSISIYATSVAPNTWLARSPDLLQFQAGGNVFNRRLTSVENVVQTITHETGHFLGLGHDDVMRNREFDAIKRFRGL